MPKLILVTGDTYPHREALRALGGRWNPARKGWMVPEDVADRARALVDGGSHSRSAQNDGIQIATPTEEQLAIRDAALNSDDNLFLDARAGASKTTTSLWLLGMLDVQKKAMVAFNVDIKEDIKEKASSDTKVMTMNGFGFGACLRAWNVKKATDIKVDRDYLFEVFKARFTVPVVRERAAFFGKVKKLIELAKGALIDTSLGLDAVAEDMSILSVDYDLDLNGEASEAIKIACETMEAQRLDRSKRAGMDFVDQMWLPVVHDLPLPRYDVLVIDEAQDTNALQLEMLARAAADGTRVIAVGDRRQCVAVDTQISTSRGAVRASRLRAGNKILAYRNGQIVEQTVKHVLPSTWTRGIKITTKNGRVLTMSPSHQIWATTPDMRGKGRTLVYLMYRPGLGFRVGVTNKCESDENPYGSRAHLEKAERLWILKVCNSRHEALFWEEFFSLTYGVPTAVFETGGRDVISANCHRLFAQFGENGRLLLAALDLSFENPNWFAYSATSKGKARRTVHLVAHAKKGSQVSLEWSGSDLDAAMLKAGVKVCVEPGNRRRLRKFFNSYREALSFGTMLTKAAKANFRERLSTDKGHLYLLTASALIAGMCVPVLGKDTLEFEEISKVETVDGVAFVDLDVDDASNFFGGGILSHNCIYSFRGADHDAVDNIINRFNMRTMPLTVTFRCGKAIVAEAQKIVPDFKAGPKNAEGIVRDVSISKMFDQIRPGDFVISRTNAPLVAACMHALSRGIPSAVVGRDVGGTLMNLVKKMKASNVKELEERLEVWLQKEVAKFSAKVPVNEAAIEVATDKVESLLAIISDCDDMAAVQTKIETLFVADASESRVDFTTTHKAKGRERARVFLFRDTFLLPKRNKTTGEWLPPSEEEYNLLYVAITRAKNELVYVDGARKLGKAA